MKLRIVLFIYFAAMVLVPILIGMFGCGHSHNRPAICNSRCGIACMRDTECVIIQNKR